MQASYISRRVTLLAGAAALLSACVSGGGQTSGGGYRAPDPAPRPVPNAGWDAWVEGYKGRAAGRGISQSTMDAAFR
ncbi:MAG: lytic murein transglycosylase, partial [Rhodobacterales bacterium]|nr:lytic murein transglycosylase [Rhodobacterales bacterium]